MWYYSISAFQNLKAKLGVKTKIIYGITQNKKKTLKEMFKYLRKRILLRLQ